VREISPEVGNFGFVFDAREHHLVPGNLPPRIGDERGEAGLIPGKACVLPGGRVLIALCRPGLAPSQSVELRAQRVLRPLPRQRGRLDTCCERKPRQPRGPAPPRYQAPQRSMRPIVSRSTPIARITPYGPTSIPQTKVTPLAPKGWVRMRLPVAKKIALPRAAPTGIVPISPKLPGSSPTEMISTVTSGAWSIRRT